MSPSPGCHPEPFAFLSAQDKLREGSRFEQSEGSAQGEFHEESRLSSQGLPGEFFSRFAPSA